ncbi:hypothetical protein HSEST_1413 [Halapricum desulfuricans]|uniref:Uncharacterized protein n=1 Tax=Halapricum desulfuricans TaxID=2841257 RepID=A0A897NR86_9EURY|nr:hypothetical protein HSEST_1413 [Halapricum desulfuricans]
MSTRSVTDNDADGKRHIVLSITDEPPGVNDWNICMTAAVGNETYDSGAGQ